MKNKISWYRRESVVDKFGITYEPVWFVVDGEVHRGIGNGKFFTSHDDHDSYHESKISYFAFRSPDWRPISPQKMQALSSGRKPHKPHAFDMF